VSAQHPTMDTGAWIRSLVERCFGRYDRELHVGGLPISRIADRHGTPLFVYDRRMLDRSLDALKTALPPEFDVYYSVKANPNLAILRHFILRGCGLEIASSGEFRQAILAGCPPERILFAGPGKTESELEIVLSGGIGEIHLESPTEAARIVSICRRLTVQARVSVRINPSGDSEGGAIRMGGKPAAFGVDEEKLDPLIDGLISEASIDFRGIHLFMGTQILDHAVLTGQYRKAIALGRRVATRIARPLSTLDFGGGLGIPYFQGERSLDLVRLHEDLAALMTEVRNDPAFRNTQLLVEPGRYLVGESGVYVARITDIKESRGKTFLVLDGGMHHHLAASGNLGQTIKRNYPVALLTKMADPVAGHMEIVGPLCTPLDTLGRNVALPKAEIGDLVGFFQSGAYGRSASPMDFLSHRRPPEVWIDNGTDFLIRRRGTTEEITQTIPLPLPL
jgi:diaminopimelate decarboxylase